jgi:hypothetical protein
VGKSENLLSLRLILAQFLGFSNSTNISDGRNLKVLAKVAKGTDINFNEQEVSEFGPRKVKFKIFT